MGITYLYGDNRDRLKDLPTGSAHAVVTSPPYFGLRAYGGEQPDPREIGREPSVEAYIEALVEVSRELRRVLRGDGVYILNLGDGFAANGRASGAMAATGLDTPSRAALPRPEASDPQLARWRRDWGEGLKIKDKLLLPYRVALALQSDGWYLRQDVPWVKANGMPESAEDRPGTSHESIFLLAKQPRYYWDRAAILQPAVRGSARSTFTGGKTGINAGGRASVLPRSEDGTRNYRTNDGFRAGLDDTIEQTAAYLAHLLAVRDAGGLLLNEEGEPLAMVENPRPWSGAERATCPHCHGSGVNPERLFAVAPTQKQLAALRKDDPCPLCKGKRTIVLDATDHFAVFPPELIRPFIRAGSPARCCPMCGAGWVRVVERTGHVTKREAAHVPNNTATKVDSTGWAPATRATDALQPGCACPGNDGSGRALILDPFAGSGTTGRVALEEGRDAVLIDLYERYGPVQARRADKLQLPLMPDA